MTTAELVSQLLQLDPTGELHVTVRNSPIRYLDRTPAYYDGPQLVATEIDGEEGYKFLRTGQKVTIHTADLHDILFEHPNTPINCEDLPQERKEETERYCDQIRQASKNLDRTMLVESFTEWAEDRIKAFVGEAEVKWNVPPKVFADRHNIEPEYPKPWPLMKSMVDLQWEWWDSQFETGLADLAFPEIRAKTG